MDFVLHLVVSFIIANVVFVFTLEDAKAKFFHYLTTSMKITLFIGIVKEAYDLIIQNASRIHSFSDMVANIVGVILFVVVWIAKIDREEE